MSKLRYTVLGIVLGLISAYFVNAFLMPYREPFEEIEQRPSVMYHVSCPDNFVIDNGMVQCYNLLGEPVGKPFPLPSVSIPAGR
jgi:hypothetical protein